MRDGDEVRLGRVRLVVLATPGHCPESISIVVYDLDMSNDVDVPYAVLTGDTLFIGDVGRPDLRASLGWSAERLSSMLYDSLHRKLVPRPDETLVYPADGAGSLCGKSLSTDRVSTIGVQRLYNSALARLLELVGAGGQLLDTRDPAEFEGAHMRGAINVGLGGAYATWCGMILQSARPVVLVAEPGREVDAATRLGRIGRIGFDNVAGYLAGGMQALDDAPELIQRTARVTATTLAELLASAPPPLLVDVRTEREWQAGRIDGATNIPLPRPAAEMATLLSVWPLVVYCASAYRSAIAGGLMRRGGRPAVTDLVGGIGAWASARLANASADR